jgi:hypothetical protein
VKKAKASAAGGEAAGDDGSPAVTIEKRAKGQLGQLLASAQGESVQAAMVSGSNPVECEVYLDNELAGYYKGRDPGHLERNIKYRLEQVGRKHEVRVVPVAKPEESGPAGEPVSAESGAEGAGEGSAENTSGGETASASAGESSSHAEASS